ncbi:hypothetical protein QQ020_23405 [Fulvivirgaceae bacterium BMA12]|uniref:Uncharacterized protein n=1 Tax=Agaribacillus aureus TaxID=3051825 RepID=A0ABT8LBM2_9BACT|nr:hypothetical protein [Fulvivirgaceae bacterium BMA12]
MDELKNERNRLRETFPKSLRDDRGVSETFGGPQQYYAIGSEDEVIKRFKLILRSGNKYSVPYSLLPILELSGSSELSIMAYGLLITIEGRNLEPVEEYLSNEILVWLKESSSGKDDGKSQVFISNIMIEGKAVSKQVE